MINEIWFDDDDIHRVSGSDSYPLTNIDVAHVGVAVTKYSHSLRVSSTRLIENVFPSDDDVTDQSAPPIGAASVLIAPDFTK